MDKLVINIIGTRSMNIRKYYDFYLDLYFRIMLLYIICLLLLIHVVLYKPFSNYSLSIMRCGMTQLWTLTFVGSK